MRQHFLVPIGLSQFLRTEGRWLLHFLSVARKSEKSFYQISGEGEKMKNLFQSNEQKLVLLNKRWQVWSNIYIHWLQLIIGHSK